MPLSLMRLILPCTRPRYRGCGRFPSSMLIANFNTILRTVYNMTTYRAVFTVSKGVTAIKLSNMPAPIPARTPLPLLNFPFLSTNAPLMLSKARNRTEAFSAVPTMSDEHPVYRAERPRVEAVEYIITRGFFDWSDLVEAKRFSQRTTLKDRSKRNEWHRKKRAHVQQCEKQHSYLERIASLSLHIRKDKWQSLQRHPQLPLQAATSMVQAFEEYLSIGSCWEQLPDYQLAMSNMSQLDQLASISTPGDKEAAMNNTANAERRVEGIKFGFNIAPPENISILKEDS